MNKIIAKIVEQRQINKLYHFTRAENLQNICQFGLVPRQYLDAQQMKSVYNDEYRFDNCPNAICLSIEFPNYKMFYKLRKENPTTDWAVLQLDASILYKFSCAYCWTNAGDATIYNEPLQQRMKADAFKDMFGDRPSYPQRCDLNIYECYPTNPQAEVLVFGVIPTEYIQSIYFERVEVLQNYQEYILNEIPQSINTSLFLPRIDWSAWQN